MLTDISLKIFIVNIYTCTHAPWNECILDALCSYHQTHFTVIMVCYTIVVVCASLKSGSYQRQIHHAYIYIGADLLASVDLRTLTPRISLVSKL